MYKGLWVVLALAVVSTTAQLTDDCLACMCWVSSTGCVMPDPNCVDNGWGLVCGPWAITEPYWKDGGYQGGTFAMCVEDWTCNENTVRSYLARYVKDPNASCEIYARTHVGGPSGATSDTTLDYWYQVRNCVDYSLFTPPP